MSWEVGILPDGEGNAEVKQNVRYRGCVQPARDTELWSLLERCERKGIDKPFNIHKLCLDVDVKSVCL